MNDPIIPAVGAGSAGESAGAPFAATRPASDQRRDPYAVNFLTESVLYALAEMRVGIYARAWDLHFRPARGLWVAP